MSICPDCDDSLVDRPAGQSGGAASSPDDGWIGICNPSSAMLSELIKGALDSNNIPSVVAPAEFRSLVSLQSSGDGDTDDILSANVRVVMVPKEFKQEATMILQVMLGDEFSPVEVQ